LRLLCFPFAPLLAAMASLEEEGRAEISPQEEKELRRVFDKLCDFNAKQK
jgi:hypothetical protein